MRTFPAVSFSRESIAALSPSESRARFPRTTKRTPLSISVPTSFRIDCIIRPIRASTSLPGRFQFSSENAKSERYSTPASTAASVQARTLSTPLRWP